MLYFENDYCEGAHEAILKRFRDMDRILSVTKRRKK